MFRWYNILNNILVDSPGLHQITHRDGNKEVPRHCCLEGEKKHFRTSKLVTIVETFLNTQST